MENNILKELNIPIFKMKPTKTEVRQELICKECQELVYTCDSCNCYFDDEEEIFCNSGEHFCRTCGEKR